MKMDKVKVLTILVIVLLLLNITTIAGAWKLVKVTNLTELKAPSAKDFMIEKLQLNEEQQAEFELLRKEHFDQIGGLLEQIHTEKDEMYDLLKSNNPDTASTYAHIAQIMQHEERLERITFEHFRKVRAICNDEQKQHFDVIIDQVMHMIMQPKHKTIRLENQPMMLP